MTTQCELSRILDSDFQVDFDGQVFFSEIAIRWMLLDLNDDKSTMIQATGRLGA